MTSASLNLQSSSSRYLDLSPCGRRRQHSKELKQAHRETDVVSKEDLSLAQENVETFFKTIKAELIWRRSWETRRQAEMAIFEYINGF